MTDPTADPAAEPPGMWAKLGAALPVALAAIATTFAGMSSGEMARAMFWRSAAAQDQARATGQWTLAGFKRDRALVMETSAETMLAGVTQRPPIPADPPGRVDPAAWATARAWLSGDGPPRAELPPLDERITASLAASRDRAPDDEQLRLAAVVPMAVISDAIRDAEEAIERTDRTWEPVVRAAQQFAATSVVAGRPFQAARFEMEGRRYATEARLNQGVSQLYEVRVRRLTAESERHRRRSENFFYAMLVGQVGATGGSLALARHRRSLLWLFAGLSGLVAVAFGGYVYLTL